MRLPAEDMERVLVVALQLKMDKGDPRTWRLLRGSVALLVDFIADSRGDTSVHLRSGDVQLLRDGLDRQRIEYPIVCASINY